MAGAPEGNAKGQCPYSRKKSRMRGLANGAQRGGTRFRGASVGHEGRRHRQVAASVGFRAFHEGRGARKTDP
jgi:hypothetical protein